MHPEGRQMNQIIYSVFFRIMPLSDSVTNYPIKDLSAQNFRRCMEKIFEKANYDVII